MHKRYVTFITACILTLPLTAGKDTTPLPFSSLQACNALLDLHKPVVRQKPVTRNKVHHQPSHAHQYNTSLKGTHYLPSLFGGKIVAIGTFKKG